MIFTLRRREYGGTVEDLLGEDGYDQEDYAVDYGDDDNDVQEEAKQAAEQQEEPATGKADADGERDAQAVSRSRHGCYEHYDYTYGLPSVDQALPWGTSKAWAVPTAISDLIAALRASVSSPAAACVLTATDC